MHARIRTSLALLLALVLAISLAGCGTTDERVVEVAEPEQQQQAPAEETAPSGPLPDEELYLALLGIGLDFSYEAVPDDGELTVAENMDGYGALLWADDDGHSIVITRRYVEGEPEQWVYVDESAPGSGVTDVSPTGAQLLAWDELATKIVTALGGEPELTRGYAWTSASGIGSTVYATGELAGGSTDDPNLWISFGEGELLQRVDFALP